MFKIFVENLSAYNNGYSKGKWFTLPVFDMEEIFHSIFDEHELDENGQPMGDWAIHDYEFPVRIHEYQSIETLSEVVHHMESAVNFKLLNDIATGFYDIDDIVSFAQSVGCESALDDFVVQEILVSTLQSDLNEGDLLSVKNKLQDVNNINDSYFMREGDGNFRSINNKDLKDSLDAIFEQLFTNFTV